MREDSVTLKELGKLATLIEKLGQGYSVKFDATNGVGAMYVSKLGEDGMLIIGTTIDELIGKLNQHFIDDRKRKR